MGALSKFTKLSLTKKEAFKCFGQSAGHKNKLQPHDCCLVSQCYSTKHLKGRMVDHLRALAGLGHGLWHCRSTSAGAQAQSSSQPNSHSPPQDPSHVPEIWKDVWEPLPQIPVGELKQGVSSAAVTSGSPAPGAVPRREGAALCRTAPSGAFPTGIPSPACRRRRIYGYAVRTTSTPRGKSARLQPHPAYPEINLPCFILLSGYELIPSS